MTSIKKILLLSLFSLSLPTLAAQTEVSARIYSESNPPSTIPGFQKGSTSVVSSFNEVQKVPSSFTSPYWNNNALFQFVTEFGKNDKSKFTQCELRVKIDAFDDSIVIEKDQNGKKITVFQLLQKHYWKNKAINELLKSRKKNIFSDEDNWKPWDKSKAGAPELVLNKDGVQLFFDTKTQHGRVNVLTFVKPEKSYINLKNALSCTQDSKSSWTFKVKSTSAYNTLQSLAIKGRLAVSVTENPLDPNADEDKDGLTNGEEDKLGTNPENADTDGDGVSDKDEVVDVNKPRDSDSDGTIDAKDSDDDGDGILTKDEIKDATDANLTNDVDSDGAPNYIDLDSDGDGVQDADEKDDKSANGVKDYLEAKTDADQNKVKTGGDSDKDGISDKEECNATAGSACKDSDKDGIPDHLDADSDNNGVKDADELTPNRDTDGDGQKDRVDADDDGDGFSDKNEIKTPNNPLADDKDGDGIPAYKDGDEINGGNTADGSGDSDGDGLSDKFECKGATVKDCVDTDGDNVPDYMDRDSDNDGDSDRSETNGGKNTNSDKDGDKIPSQLDKDETNKGGVSDGTGDSDKDGVSDKVECNDSTGSMPAKCVDSDKDGTPDYMDADSDNDGVCDGPNSVAGVCKGNGEGVDKGPQVSPISPAPISSSTKSNAIKTGELGVGGLNAFYVLLLLAGAAFVRKRK